MGVRGGASMRMGAAPPSSAPKSLLAVSGESESESDLPRFDTIEFDTIDRIFVATVL